MAKIESFYKLIQPEPDARDVSENDHNGFVASTFGGFKNMLAVSGSRLSKYTMYDDMDDDTVISRALTLLADEVTGNYSKSIGLPLEAKFNIPESVKNADTVMNTVKEVLRHWIEVQDLTTRMHGIIRNMLKYGDCYFIKVEKFAKWEFVHPRYVIGAAVAKNDRTKIIKWYISPEYNGSKSTEKDVLGSNKGKRALELPGSQMMRFTLNDGMTHDEAFAVDNSVLRNIMIVHKQKKLLEAAMVIYRIVRAPERKVFYIDTGGMNPRRSKTYLEEIKNSVNQKKMPNARNGHGSKQGQMGEGGGQGKANASDTLYDAHSMSEDYFLAQGKDGKGSRIEVLPGGQSLGETGDLDYFVAKEASGLGIPRSMMPSLSGDGNGALFNDGRLGQSYIEELRFSQLTERFQRHIETVLDAEFKMYIRQIGITVDNTLFDIELPPPSNFGVYRQQELDAALMATYTQVDTIPYIAKKFAMARYLNMTPDEIVENEHAKMIELGYNPDKMSDEEIKTVTTMIYGGDMAAGGDDGLGDDGLGDDEDLMTPDSDEKL
jgi:hypothetical protein